MMAGYCRVQQRQTSGAVKHKSGFQGQQPWSQASDRNVCSSKYHFSWVKLIGTLAFNSSILFLCFGKRAFDAHKWPSHHLQPTTLFLGNFIWGALLRSPDTLKNKFIKMTIKCVWRTQKLSEHETVLQGGYTPKENFEIICISLWRMYL